MAVSPPRRVAAEMAASRLGELGWTQEKLAAETGLATESINRFLNGRAWPQVRNRAAISRALWDDPLRLDEIAKGHVPDDRLASEVAALRALVEKLMQGDDSDHRYASRARAARIREIEAQQALLMAELEELRGE